MAITFDMKAVIEAQCAGAGLRLDAGETAAFARELEDITAGLVEEKFPEYKALGLVPLKTNFAAGAQFHTWREVKDIGKAAFMHMLAPEDFNTVEPMGIENTLPFRSIGVKYLYSVEELRAAALMQIKPDSRKASGARKAIEAALDLAVLGSKTGLYGDAFKGLLHDDMSVDDTSSAGTPNWDTGTVDDIADTFRTMADNAFKLSKGTFTEFDFVLTTKAATKIGKWVPSTTAGLGKTVQEFVLNSVPRVRSISFSDRGAGQGASSKERILCYPRSPEVLEAALPIRFESFAPQLRGMVFETYNHAKYGGLRVYHPSMIRRCDVTAT
jgi:hypothetical protein